MHLVCINHTLFVGGEIIMQMEAFNNDCDCNYIKDTLVKIDKLQKEVATLGTVSCISCDASLFSSANNTIPVTLFSKCGTTFIGYTDLVGTTTGFFRVESIRCGRYVTLRMLTSDSSDPENPTLVATTRTIILDIDEIAGIQCYEPIIVELCNSSIGTQTPN